MALPIVLAGLAGFGMGGGIIWNKYLRASKDTPYDIVIRLNSLLALRTTGWEIALSENAIRFGQTEPTSEGTRGLVVAVLGSYNRGKSFLLNLLCDTKLPSGNLVSTEGISITIPKNTAENIIFIDTAGTDTAIPKNELDDKKATEALLREVALHLSSFIIIVVNRLRATDQTYIRQVLTRVKESKQDKDIIIVHNLMDIETKKDIQDVINRELINLFEAKPETMKIRSISEPVKFYRSENYGIALRHFILAKIDSPAAEMWNRQTIDAIMIILQGATNSKRNLNVIGETISFVNTKLSQILINENSQDNKVQTEQDPNTLNIVLSERVVMEDLKANPTPLKLSLKLAYDEAGYFMGFDSMDTGQWQPLYSVYEYNDEICAIIELGGVKSESTRVTVIAKGICVEGEREDFKLSEQRPTVHHEKIPYGRFKLNIALNCEVNQEQAKLERDIGMYKIRCPKRKDTPTVLQ
ncbi:hypothetical protein I4U23_016070 [Adineta vaga]|nr:hypothetical protein I4U23_016070 [Adineta vaga]